MKIFELRILSSKLKPNATLVKWFPERDKLDSDQLRWYRWLEALKNFLQLKRNMDSLVRRHHEPVHLPIVKDAPVQDSSKARVDHPADVFRPLLPCVHQSSWAALVVGLHSDWQPAKMLNLILELKTTQYIIIEKG